MAESPSYQYRLDAEDRIVEVSPEWLRFAVENEAPELNAAAVLGRSLWGFVHGEATRRLYALLFSDLRARQLERHIPFRCDSPTIVRQMVLTLRSQSGGSIELEGRLLASETRAAVPLFDPAARRSSGQLRICSLCRRLDAGGEWVEVAEAIGRRRLFAAALPPQLLETVCPHCTADLAAGGFYIRPAQPAERGRLLALMQADLQGEFTVIQAALGLDLPAFARLYAERGEVRTLLREGRIAGYCWIEQRERTLHLHALVVEEAQRGRGVGTAALHALIAEFAGTVDLIELGVKVANRRARTLYERNGFRRVRELPAIGFQVMRRPLAGPIDT